jgi:TetR/AcrR family fatty acid metabolism transcriptional regulator
MANNDATNNHSQREEKRQRILRAAIDEFARKGYFSARMADVAKAASVADGTLYLYFEGKEHLLISIFDDVLSRSVAQLREQLAQLDDPIAKLRAMIRLHLETLAEDRSLAHVLQIETRHSRQFMSLLTRGRLGEYFDLIRAIIEEGQKVGVFRRELSPGLATNIIFGAVDELVNSWLLSEEPGDLARLDGPLMDLLSHGMVAHDHSGGTGT